MKPKEYLRKYNEWRRGADTEQPDPTELGEQIDAAIGAMVMLQETAKLAATLTVKCEKLERERDEARELVKAYQEYTNLLVDEINDMAAVTYVHGWRTNRYEPGKVLRDKIKRLEETK